MKSATGAWFHVFCHFDQFVVNPVGSIPTDYGRNPSAVGSPWGLSGCSERRNAGEDSIWGGLGVNLVTFYTN